MEVFAVIKIRYLLIRVLSFLLLFVKIKAVLKNPKIEVINNIALSNMEAKLISEMQAKKILNCILNRFQNYYNYNQNYKLNLSKAGKCV
jgi:hypothetical protein